MEQIKRSHTDNDHPNKKIKFNNSRSLLEDLPNEILYEIFDYLYTNQIFEMFSSLNKRFQNLYMYANPSIQVNISTIPKSTFELYHKNVIIPNKHRIRYLRLSNPFTVDLVFSPPRLISKFIHLQTLVLDHMKAKYLENILIHLAFLSNLHSLSINPIDRVKNLTLFYLNIFRLPNLKYCQIKFDIESDQEPLLFMINQSSSIEHLVIKNRFRINSFNNLLLYLPRLRYLSIDHLDGSFYHDIVLSPIVFKDLKYISLKLNLIGFDVWEKLAKNFFRSVENLHLTTRYDPAYLDAQQWEELIVAHMPNLRVFDLNHDGSIGYDSSSYHDVIKKFNSTFWTKRKWFFTHQHDWQERLDSAVLHSTDPYRRKDYTFYWEMSGQLCLHSPEMNLNSVKHVRIGGKQATINRGSYFPCATELTLKSYFTIPDLTMGITINRVVCLQRITTLTIEHYDFPFEKIVELIRSTPHLQTLKIRLVAMNKKSMKLLQQTQLFRDVSTMNQIKYLELNDRCSMEQIQMLVSLFSQLEHFKIAMRRKEIRSIVQYLLSKTNNHTRHLFFLCLSQTPKVCLREVDLLIRLEGLVDDYFIKWVNRDLYVWW